MKKSFFGPAGGGVRALCFLVPLISVCDFSSLTAHDNGAITTVVVVRRLATNIIVRSSSSIPVHSTTSSNLLCVRLYWAAETDCSMARTRDYLPLPTFTSASEYFFHITDDNGVIAIINHRLYGHDIFMYPCALDMSYLRRARVYRVAEPY